ncbi:hypothetical protein niasHT_034527 [Heterodera trifolii]|uniref:BED-type domain-containing protein n=1 Tax=Heterodera trifolii TaxID=157864 RepID=A0ABD2I022_9BILA
MLLPSAAMKMRRKCSFNPAWQHQYAFVRRSKKGNGFFYCAYCEKDINVQTMGISAVKSHIDNNKHRQMEQQQIAMSAALGNAENGTIVTANQQQQQYQMNNNHNCNATVGGVKAEESPLQQLHQQLFASSSHDMQMAASTSTVGEEAAAENVHHNNQHLQQSAEGGGKISDFDDGSDNELFISTTTNNNANDGDNDDEEEEEEGKEAIPWHWGGKYGKCFEQIVKDGTLVAKVRKLHQLAAESGIFDHSQEGIFDGMMPEAVGTALVEERTPIVIPFRRRLMTTEMMPSAQQKMRSQSVEDDTLNEDEQLAHFDWNKQKIELQILEAELIQKQLSNFQRCTELGIPARVHLPVGIVPSGSQSATGWNRRFATFSNAHALQHSSERQRHMPHGHADEGTRDNGGIAGMFAAAGDDGTPCDFVAFADI